MPQQINLCTPILLTQKRYLSAQTMLEALAVFIVLGGGLCAYWVWSLNVASDGFKKTLTTQTHEIESLQKAVTQGNAGAVPVDANLSVDIQSRRTELAQRENLLHEVQLGLFKPGWGHAARLELLARTIPAPVWVTEVKTDDTQLEISGFTLEPAALSDWVAKLAASPLLEGQELTTLKVENARAAVTKAVVGKAASVLPVASSAMPVTPPAMWSFHLVSSMTHFVGVAGGKP